jgi:hypothetical protein
MARGLTEAQDTERELFRESGRARFSPAARYYPTYRPPLLDDGTLDVRAWCADLDTWCNQGTGR